MKVGKQLTEAMLLKASATRRNARRSFNGKLKVLNASMDELAQSDEEKQQNKLDCKIFDNFCIFEFGCFFYFQFRKRGLSSILICYT